MFGVMEFYVLCQTYEVPPNIIDLTSLPPDITKLPVL